jgi:hypothetical protein
MRFVTGKQAVRLITMGLATGALVTSVLPVRAEMTAREFLTKHTTSQTGRAFLGGVAAGIGWANGVMNDLTNGQIYCPPGKIALTLDQNIDLMKQYLATAAEPEKDYPLGFVLLLSLRSAFPCKS